MPTATRSSCLQHLVHEPPIPPVDRLVTGLVLINDNRILCKDSLCRYLFLPFVPYYVEDFVVSFSSCKFCNVFCYFYCVIVVYMSFYAMHIVMQSLYKSFEMCTVSFIPFCLQK